MAEPSDAREGQLFAGSFSVKRITFANAENGYAVLYLVPADRPAAAGFVAVGTFGEPRIGDCYRIEGTWVRDPKHGLQLQAQVATPELPRSLAAIERYLAGTNIRGLGPHYAHALVSYFREDTFKELQSGGGRLEQVPGIGPVRAQSIRAGWAEHQGTHELMLKLQGVAGLSPRQAQAIYRQYGREAWELLLRDAYRLAEDLHGFGFQTCDRIAQSLGTPPEAPQRLQAAVLHVLREALGEGHLWSAPAAVAAHAAELLGCEPAQVHAQLDELATQQRVLRELVGTEDNGAVGLYLPHVARVEQRLAQRLSWWLRQSPASGLDLDQEHAQALLGRVDAEMLTPEQRDAVLGVLCSTRLSILTGGPGTGKTTTIRVLLACLDLLGVSYALCATTGRASKQLASATHRNAATVHRHLRIGTAQESEPVRETLLIVDESSMIDIWLLDEILLRLGERNHLLLVGDVDQLPSVGPGAVLQDLIEAAERDCSSVHVSRLTTIFRQEAGADSLIVANCHRIRTGERPLTPTSQQSDYFEMLRDSPEQARELAVSLAAERLPKFLDVPPAEIQVLAPMHGGEAGIRALNTALQRVLNPPAQDKAELPPTGSHGRVLREGDKVRQTRNNYQKGVLNGDLGTIHKIDREEKVLSVRYDDREVAYDLDELDELVHAWAMTVHAAQGSQWPAVVILMLTNHYVMLERNILYTALSRAERLAVLITQEKALRIAVAQDRTARRRTNLPARLCAALRAPLETLDAPPHSDLLL